MILGGVLISPHLGRLVDKASRFNIVQVGIYGQIIGVSSTALTLITMKWLNQTQALALGAGEILGFAALALSGQLAQAAGTIADISVATDIAPSVTPPERLGAFNIRFRQVDLATEVLSPFIAGLL